MSLGLTMAMPMLVMNMAAEMIYILEQRLIAQKVKGLKRAKVIGDVIRAISRDTFQEELYQPRAMQTPAVTLQLFTRLAHSSVMRLNATSMEKLFDLLSMGYKYQVLCSPHPRYLRDITLKKFASLNAMVLADEPTAALLDSARQRFIKTFDEFSDGDYYLLKQSICRFFQGKRVKVSIFLQNHMQNFDGSIVLDLNGYLPQGIEIPGLCRFYDQGNMVRTESIPILVPHTIKPYPGFFRTTLGDNLYQEEGSALHTSTLSEEAESKTTHSSGGSSSPKEPAEKPLSSSAAEELSLLASLISGPPHDDEPIILDLIGNRGRGDVAGDMIVIDLQGSKEMSMKVLSDRVGLDSLEPRHRLAPHRAGESKVGSGPSSAAQGSHDDDGDDMDDLLSMMDRVK